MGAAINRNTRKKCSRRSNCNNGCIFYDFLRVRPLSEVANRKYFTCNRRRRQRRASCRRCSMNFYFWMDGFSHSIDSTAIDSVAAIRIRHPNHTVIHAHTDRRQARLSRYIHTWLSSTSKKTHMVQGKEQTVNITYIVDKWRPETVLISYC